MELSKAFDKRFVVLVGNYGSGKTELALNLALDAAKTRKTTLVDLDIVNPYFRSGEKAEELRAAGVRVLMPTFALSTVDIPALPAEIQSVFEAPGDLVIFDVGGDDTGAAALGRYAPSFAVHRAETMVALVVNTLRPLTQNVEDIADMAQRIEARGRLSLDMVVNNTNLADDTEKDMLMQGAAIVKETADRLGVARVLHAGTERLLAACPELGDTVTVRRMMAPSWMEDA